MYFKIYHKVNNNWFMNYQKTFLMFSFEKLKLSYSYLKTCLSEAFVLLASKLIVVLTINFIIFFNTCYCIKFTIL